MSVVCEGDLGTALEDWVIYGATLTLPLLPALFHNNWRQMKRKSVSVPGDEEVTTHLVPLHLSVHITVIDCSFLDYVYSRAYNLGAWSVGLCRQLLRECAFRV